MRSFMLLAIGCAFAASFGSTPTADCSSTCCVSPCSQSRSWAASTSCCEAMAPRGVVRSSPQPEPPPGKTGVGHSPLAERRVAVLQLATLQHVSRPLATRLALLGILLI